MEALQAACRRFEIEIAKLKEEKAIEVGSAGSLAEAGNDNLKNLTLMRGLTRTLTLTLTLIRLGMTA